MSSTEPTSINYTFNAPIGQVNTGTVNIHGDNIGTQNNTASPVANPQQARLQHQIQTLQADHQATLQAWECTIDPTAQIRLQRQLEQLETQIAKLQQNLEQQQ
jgi:hypothetical protein